MSKPDKLIDNFITAKVGLLLRSPFFGNIVSRLKLVDASEWCSTAATDGRHIFYNRKFFEPMTPKQVEFVFCHEVYHMIYNHMGRYENRNKQIFNIACDYAVNGEIVQEKIGEMPDIKVFHDKKYYGKPAEEIYDLIYDEMDEEELNALGKLLDEHIEWDKEPKDGSSRPKYSKEELRKIRDEIRDNMIQAAQSCEPGKVPAGISRIIKNLTEPKMNWKELIQQQIQSLIREDFSFSRPNRKGWHLNAILPGSNFAEKISVAISLDMSGSISNEQARVFLSEVKGIMCQYKDFEIVIWSFDTEIYNLARFDAYNIDEFDNYEPKGGGGTDLDMNWAFMRDNDIQPKKFIVFTDGYVSGWGDPDYCDTIFIVHGSKSIEAPHGITVKYDMC